MSTSTQVPNVARRPTMEENCAICFCPLAHEPLSWCRKKCGQSIHSTCYNAIRTYVFREIAKNYEFEPNWDDPELDGPPEDDDYQDEQYEDAKFTDVVPCPLCCADTEDLQCACKDCLFLDEKLGKLLMAEGADGDEWHKLYEPSLVHNCAVESDDCDDEGLTAPDGDPIKLFKELHEHIRHETRLVSGNDQWLDWFAPFVRKLKRAMLAWKHRHADRSASEERLWSQKLYAMACHASHSHFSRGGIWECVKFEECHDELLRGQRMRRVGRCVAALDGLWEFCVPIVDDGRVIYRYQNVYRHSVEP